MSKLDELNTKQVEQYVDSSRITQSPGPFGVVTDIQLNPIPKGVVAEIVCGESIDWHDLEEFVVGITPTKFENLLKLIENRIRDEMRVKYYKEAQYFGKKMGGGTIWIIVAVIIIAIVGVLVLMFAPQLTQLMKGMMPL